MNVKRWIYSVLSVLVFFGCNERKVASYIQQIFEPDRGMLYISAGEFIMGTNEGNADESPEHTVYLDAYYIDENPITNEEYFEFWDNLNPANKKNLAPESFERDTWPERAFYRPRHPVVGVSWEMAYNYAKWANKRLPTEAEWEKAARGTSQRIYPWGDTPPEFDGKFRANFKTFDYQKDGFSNTNPVGYYNGKNLNTESGRSYYELNDMAGNVWEWVYDWYSNKYYSITPYNNPHGPPFEESNKKKVIRGGSWNNSLVEELKTINRNYISSTEKENNIGFRCVRSAN